MYTMRTLHSLRGFTLIELMIGMLLGVFVLGGVMSVFIANSQTVLAKRELDNAQESFRFASHTISRMVRNSKGINKSENLKLELEFEIEDDLKIFDCLGEVPSSNFTNTFIFEKDPENPDDTKNGRLLCEGQVLAEGFNVGDDDFGFKYGTYEDSKLWIADEDYKDAADIADAEWNKVVSVRVTVRTNPGLKTVFTATSRHRAIEGGGDD
jgi:type II secretory pathway pseudopilin PulG